MVKFPNFSSINTLSINFANSNSNTSTIYGNGRNQVAVIIKLSLLDANIQPVRVEPSVLSQAVYLCDYYTGVKLPDNPQKGFFYSKEKNDYCTTTAFSTETGSRFTTMQLYLSADVIHDGKVISCGISIDGVGDVDTSENGTDNKLPNGTTYFHQNSITVNSSEPIDYSKKRNVTITAGDFVDISGNLGWTSRLITEGPYKKHFSGTCKRRIVYIEPNVANTHQQKFLKHLITYVGIENKDVSDGMISWQYGVNTPKENCFELIKTAADGAGMPCAVIGRGINRDDYQLNLWYSRQNYIYIDGQMFVVDGSYFYRFCPYIRENHFGVDEKGSATLLLYKFTMPENNTYQYHWHDVIRPVMVQVTDMYGNDGSFQLTFDDQDNFDKPGLV